MTHPQRKSAEQQSAFTITQIALGSPLQFEPALGSIELDILINNYVPGHAMPQQKRAQVVLEFLNSIDALCYTHPVSIRYHVPQVLTPHNMPRISSMPSLSAPSSGATIDHTVGQDKLVTSKSTGALKRSSEEAALPNPSSAKRLPGFSILTKDGVDITDLASRGPKTKEQRDHAALMRKLKACAACKKSKQRCDPSHHRPAQPALGSPNSVTPSSISARLSSISSAEGSLGSISPQSSLGESFSQSPSRSFAAHVGQSFLPRPNSKTLPLHSDTLLSDTALTDLELSALPIHDFDTEFFQLADMELDSWNTDFTTFPPTYNDCVWNNHEDVFTQNHTNDISPTTHGQGSREQIQLSTLPSGNTVVEQVQVRQDQGRHAGQHGPVVRSNTYSDLTGIDPDISHWLKSTVTWEDSKDSVSQIGVFGHTTVNTSQQGMQNLTVSQQQDYILYPESPHIDWDLEPHQISRDIGSKQRPPRPGAESGTVKKDHTGMPGSIQDSQGHVSTLERTSRSNYSAPDNQLTQIPLPGEPYRYLPSPSPSRSSEDANGVLSDTNTSEVEANASQRPRLRRSRQLYSAQSNRRHSDDALMDAVERQRDVSISESERIDETYSAVRRLHMSRGEPHNLRPVITADMDIGSQYQHNLGNSTTQFTRPQAQHMQQPPADVQNHTMDTLTDQQSQHTLLNQGSEGLPADDPQWQRIWAERDLRRAGLLDNTAEDGHSSRIRISSHNVTQVLGHADDSHQGHWIESRQESYRAPISSDIPGEDEMQNVSVEALMQQRLGLSHRDLQQINIQSHEVAQSHLAREQVTPTLPQNTKRLESRMSTTIALSILMAISFLWTIHLLAMTSNNQPGSPMSYQTTTLETVSSRNMAQVSSVSPRYDQESFSIWKDQESTCQSHTRPKLDHISLLIDSLYSRSIQVKPMESDKKLNSRPENESIPVTDSATVEEFPNQWEKQTSYSPSFTGRASSIFASTMAPSTTKCATTWTTHVPARSTIQPKEAYPNAMVKSQSQVAVKSHSPSPSPSPSSGILRDLMRKWTPPFNVGHLTMRITSLNLS